MKKPYFSLILTVALALVLGASLNAVDWGCYVCNWDFSEPNQIRCRSVHESGESGRARCTIQYTYGEIECWTSGAFCEYIEVFP